MAVKVTPVLAGNTPAMGLEVDWDDSQYVMIVTAKGLVSCGVVDMAVMGRAGAAIAVSRGTAEHPLVTVNDLLHARIMEVTEKAAAYGIAPGMTGHEALVLLSG
jgi:uncharacterized protein YunC (DUF1805 family)